MIRIVLLASVSGDEVGCVVFSTLLIRQETDYRLIPPDLLSLPEVQDLASQLRSLPQQTCGTVGTYYWKQE